MNRTFISLELGPSNFESALSMLWIEHANHPIEHVSRPANRPVPPSSTYRQAKKRRLRLQLCLNIDFLSEKYSLLKRGFTLRSFSGCILASRSEFGWCPFPIIFPGWGVNDCGAHSGGGIRLLWWFINPAVDAGRCWSSGGCCGCEWWSARGLSEQFNVLAVVVVCRNGFWNAALVDGNS